MQFLLTATNLIFVKQVVSVKQKVHVCFVEALTRIDDACSTSIPMWAMKASTFGQSKRQKLYL